MTLVDARHAVPVIHTMDVPPATVPARPARRRMTRHDIAIRTVAVASTLAAIGAAGYAITDPLTGGMFAAANTITAIWTWKESAR